MSFTYTFKLLLTNIKSLIKNFNKKLENCILLFCFYWFCLKPNLNNNQSIDKQNFKILFMNWFNILFFSLSCSSVFIKQKQVSMSTLSSIAYVSLAHVVTL